jgi:hypothetical protein
MPNYGEDRFTDEQLVSLRARTAETLHEIDAEMRRRFEERKADEQHCRAAALQFIRSHSFAFGDVNKGGHTEGALTRMLTGLLVEERALARRRA